MAQKRKLAAILSADVVGYSRLMAVNEAATVETLKAYRDIIARLVVRHGGRVVNAPGDALLAEFPSAVEAVQAAVEAQKSLEGHNIDLEPERRMQFRIGSIWATSLRRPTVRSMAMGSISPHAWKLSPKAGASAYHPMQCPCAPTNGGDSGLIESL
jgi:class 3 adenylate cyclase